MYKLTYPCGKEILIDTFNRKLAEHVQSNESQRTHTDVGLEPWRAFPNRLLLDPLCRNPYFFAGRWQWVQLYEELPA